MGGVQLSRRDLVGRTRPLRWRRRHGARESAEIQVGASWGWSIGTVVRHGIELAFSLARVTLTNSTVSGNSATEGSGGGISNEGGTLTLTNSTIAGNTAVRNGGGIFGRATLTNSTISGNTAIRGGGIAGSATLTNTTVAGNSGTEEGGGISTSGSLQLTNSLVALNSAPRGPDVLKKSGGTVMAGFSLLGIGNGSGVSNGVNGNQVGRLRAPRNPKLGPLAANGGPTQNHALQPGSPAIDAASTPDCPTTDQRGVLRPQGAACDIGSYERE